MTTTSSRATILHEVAPATGGGRGAFVVLAASVVAGLQAGTYFTWATGVMPGLANVDDRTFVAAVQEMNSAIVNPIFMATFVGTPVLTAAAAILCGPRVRPWTVAATLLAIGTVGITVLGNVPLNEALEAAGPVDKIPDLAAVRSDFEPVWVGLNIGRCFTSAGAVACLAWGALRR
jgi:uncharacterized membrane protein